MKKILLLLCLVAGIDSVAQIELTGFYGYRTGGRLDAYYNNNYGAIRVNDSPSFGAGIDYQLRPGFAVGLEWYGQKSDMDFYGITEITDIADIWLNYFLISGIYEKEIERITPFGGLGIGFSTASSSDISVDTQVYFAADLQAGVKVALNERISLKLRAAMLMPLQFGSAGIFCGSGSGCGVGVGASTTIIQGDFSGGIVLKLGDTNSSHHSPSPSSRPTW
jgi:hypothetical protein